VAENLYQLKTAALPGQSIKIPGGVYDKFGLVMAQQASGYSLVRGTGNKEQRHFP